MEVYKITNLCKTYKKGSVIANKDINLTIKEGEIFGLLGPNEAGKTTLVKQMVGLLKPTKGSIKFYDQEVSSNPEVVTHFIGYMTQRIGTLGDLRVHVR
ncbi:hypothetical protein BBF96_00715 [Anoxybacter fermentans]|uniref:ABC transporter domain-containing protein n=1 Tax=Anoxybacter fermentans TaxID=1323375 RepID=A0A3S9SUQ3_9FIRM|nr:ATP-binding cassette domain-containing protein [Anoxybacter fermentans]AZR72043.1 hypothetical protein BBF96_00715 [Anoxybacter fermentans]